METVNFNGSTRIYRIADKQRRRWGDNLLDHKVNEEDLSFTAASKLKTAMEK